MIIAQHEYKDSAVSSPISFDERPNVYNKALNKNHPTIHYVQERRTITVRLSCMF